MGKLLITESKLKSFTSVNKNVDMDLIRAEISISQDIYLQQVLGTKFLNSLLDKISLTGNTFTSDEKTLIDDYVAPYLIQMSYATLIPQLWARTLNRGLMTGDAESSSSVDVGTMKYLKNIQMQKADFYKQRLVDYLTCGGGVNKFENYTTQSTSDGMLPDKKGNYNSPIYLKNKTNYRNIPTYSEDEMIYRNKRKF